MTVKMSVLINLERTKRQWKRRRKVDKLQEELQATTQSVTCRIKARADRTPFQSTAFSCGMQASLTLSTSPKVAQMVKLPCRLEEDCRPWRMRLAKSSGRWRGPPLKVQSSSNQWSRSSNSTQRRTRWTSATASWSRWLSKVSASNTSDLDDLVRVRNNWKYWRCVLLLRLYEKLWLWKRMENKKRVTWYLWFKN